MTDKKALKILAKFRWGELPASEREYCIRAGVLTTHEPVSHEVLIQQIKDVASTISMEQAVKGFLYSVSTADFRYRTGLSSLIWANAIPEHPLTWTRDYRGYRCCICGGRFQESDGLSCLDMKSHCADRLIPQKVMMDVSSAGYVLNDLLEFAKLPEVSYCDEDIRILNRILGLAGELAPGNKVNALLKLIAAEESLSLTAVDAYSILGVLAACGVFDTAEFKSHRNGFVAYGNLLFQHDADIYYPLHLWKGKDGINYEAFKSVMGDRIGEMISANTALSHKVVYKEPAKKAAESKAAASFTDGVHLIELDDRLRYYYGLAPLNATWDKEVMYSVTHDCRKRTELYFEGDILKKMIFECRYEDVEGGGYQEIDMEVATRNRQFVLPKTHRGREKKLTPSLLMTPTYMREQFYVSINEEGGRVNCYNCVNDQMLPLPAMCPTSPEEFYALSESYIASCPEQYKDVIERFHKKERVTVKFTAGDIFRQQLTPTLYSYGLILGKVRQIEKWPELSPEHPFRHVMSQPILYRQYGIITENPDMTVEELQQIPLLDVKVAQDNDILWNTHPIVASKELVESDIDLGFAVNNKLKAVVWGLTVKFYEEDECGVFADETQRQIGLCYNGRDHSFHMTCPVALSIQLQDNGGNAGLVSKSETQSDVLKKRIAAYYGFRWETAQDEFAEKFGGITRSRYIELAKERFKR